DEQRVALRGDPYAPAILWHPYAFNLFSHDSTVDPATRYNSEEMKVVAETRRLLDAPELPIGITCIRVPVLRAHAMALTVPFDEPVAPDEARALLMAAPGVLVVDDRSANHF